MRTQIELDYAEFERSLYSYDHDNGEYGYWNYINEDSFVDYFLINEFTLNMDAGRYSTYIYKDMSGKYKLAVWDFNNACDNFTSDPVSPYQLEMENHTWFLMLCKSERFVNRVLERYAELRKTVLSEEYLTDYIDGVLAYLGPAVERNTLRWHQAVTEWEPLTCGAQLLQHGRGGGAAEALADGARQLAGQQHPHAAPVLPRVP